MGLKAEYVSAFLVSLRGAPREMRMLQCCRGVLSVKVTSVCTLTVCSAGGKWMLKQLRYSLFAVVGFSELTKLHRVKYS